MISDEIEVLRKRGRADREIAQIIRDNSSIDVTPDDLAENYASEEEWKRK